MHTVMTVLFCIGIGQALVFLPCVSRQLEQIAKGVWARICMGLVIGLAAHFAYTKDTPPASGNRIANLVMWLSNNTLQDPSGIIGEHAQAAAVEAFESETATIIATVSNGLVSSSSRIQSLTEALETNDVEVIYIIQDAPRDLPGMITNHNLSVTQERMAMTGTNTLSVWFRYSWSVSTGAWITVRACMSTNTSVDLEPVTNTFPNVETVTHENGISVDCYRYDYDVSQLGIGTNAMALIPPYEASFGGPEGEPFEVSGIGVSVTALVPGEAAVTTNVGFTGWINEMPAPWGTNLQLRCVGGAVVQALWHGTNIAGEVTL